MLGAQPSHIQAVAAMASTNGPSSLVSISVECRDLKNMDIGSLSDPLAVLQMKMSTGRYEEIGRTEMIKDNLNPQFSTPLRVEFCFEVLQEMRIFIYDIDKGTTSIEQNDFLGYADFTMGKLAGSPSQRLKLPLLSKENRPMGKSQVILQMEELKDGANELCTMQISARDLAKKDFFGKSDPYLCIFKRMPSGSWAKVLQTETFKNTLKCSWAKKRINLQELCNGDWDRELKIEVFDWNKSSEDQPIGDYVTTLRKLVDSFNAGTQGFDLRHYKGKNKFVGHIHFEVLFVEAMPTFLDYLNGGCRLNMVVAIDFTGSNGNVTKPDSLHYLHPDPSRLNEYQQAILSVGNILREYSADGLFPTFGFGAKFHTGEVSHCFNLNGQANPCCEGIPGVMAAYSQAIRAVTLWGPTNFSPIIQSTADIASRFECSAHSQQYTCLLILTDGVITDLEQTKRTVAAASMQPMSIVIVGVGNADFSAMVELDGDVNPIPGAIRDIVQFVPFRQFASSPHLLAKEVLAELPHQVLEYFRWRKVTPMPPVRQESMAVLRH